LAKKAKPADVPRTRKRARDRIIVKRRDGVRVENIETPRRIGAESYTK